MTQNKTICCCIFLLTCFIPSGLKAGNSINIRQLEKALDSKTDTAKVNALNALSWEYRRQDPQKALLYANRALAQSERLGYTSGKAFASKNLGTICWIRGEYNLAQEKYNSSLKLFRALGNREETGNLYNLFGLLCWNQGKYPEAIGHYQKASEVFKEIGDVEGEAYVFNNLAIIYYELGNFKEALSGYIKAMKCYEQLNDQAALSNTYNNIGLIYSELGNYPKAHAYFQSSLKIDVENRNRAGESKSYTNIGVAFYREGKLDESEGSHLRALEISRQIADKKGISEALMNLAEIHFLRRELGMAEEKLQQALVIKSEIGDEQGRSIVLINLGKVRMERRQYPEALQMLAEAFQITQRIGSLKNQMDAAFYLSEVYDRSGKKEDALEYYKKFVALDDSIRTQQVNNQLVNMQVEFETIRQQQQAEIWKKESIIEGGKKQALAGGIVFLALLSLIFISRQRLKHRKEKKIAELLIETQCARQRFLELEMRNMELELEFNRQSLMAYTQKLIEKNAVVESLLVQLEESNAGQPDMERQSQIGQLTEARIVTEDDWKEFKKLYNAVYPKFMSQLQEDFPAMTQAELRLSALISLKLNSREISAMLGISNDSVKKARQRLRRKMEMKIEDDLDETLLERLAP